MKLMNMLLSMMALMTTIMLTSCGSDDADDSDGVGNTGNVTITLSQNDVAASAVGGSITVNVRCTGREWTAFTDEDWLKVAVTGSTSQTGDIIITVAPNSGNSRTGVVSVKSGTVRQTITVKQSAAMKANYTELYFASVGGKDAVVVNTEEKVDVNASDDWITADVSPLTDSTNGYKTIEIVTAANDEWSSRTGTVTITAGAETVTVTVTQSSKADREMRIPEGYTLVWNDEFNEGTTPRTGDNGWWYETGANGWGNNELQNYVNGTNNPKVCFVEDGVLNIVLQKIGNEVRSIRMNTSQAWLYGYFEARLKLPKGKGTWPAFWMMPKNFTSWPADGEIDIMEEVGYNPNYVLSTIHCNKYNNGGTSIESAGRSVPTAQTDYHIYACEWTAEFLRFFIDGEPLLTYRNDGTGKDAWPFNAPFYLKLNLAWGGNWGGAMGIDDSALPTTYKIDYVRVFQKK